MSDPRTCEAVIASTAARCLGPRAAFDADTPFALLGLDSLGTLEMAAALEETLGCELPPELLLECRNGRALAARISALRRKRVTAGSPRDVYDRMYADARLPPDIEPARAVTRGTDLRAAKRILLTGATGFLGRALLAELLDSTAADIVCLVRSAEALGPWTGRRVRIIPGNLCVPRLGLAADAFDALASEVDAVVHCAAAVNWIYPYSALRATNVLGTREMLRLAARGGASFHFVSSLSVCYSTEGPRLVDETFDPLPHVRGVHLGYAQTKIIAEALVRQAGARGLPARIYRPPLITGHSVTGVYNRDDVVTALVRGCVRMGTAPDLDWTLDCVPVDQTARHILSLSAEAGPVFHLGPARPRHWRECVLWLRLHGYPVRLVPYHAWLRQMEREAVSAAHPLRPLRAFFLEPREDGLTLPELYEEPRRAQASRRQSAVRLDAALLNLYVRAMRSRGELPEPPGSDLSPRGSDLDSCAGVWRENQDLVPLSAEHSIVSELTAWRSGRQVGLFRRADTPGAIVKVKAQDVDVIAVGQALADLVDRGIGQAYARFGHRLGFAACHLREIAIYQQRDTRFTLHAPALLEAVAEPDTSTWAITIEEMRDATHLDTVNDPSAWTAPSIAAVVDGLASLQSIWLGRESELRGQPWIGCVQTSAGMREMTGLWTALAGHAGPRFASWTGADFEQVFARLIRGIPAWWPLLERGPRTLIHGDFNPRNVCLRSGRRLAAYDWELATIGSPQRDLVEFLCFALQPASAGEALRWMEMHRIALERESGSPLDPAAWREGFRAALYDLLVNRLATYALVDRVRRQPFLPRVVRAWHALYELFPLEEAS